MLVFDENEDGRADLEREVSFVGYQPGARTDLEGLVAFDTDGDGRITDEDADWERLALFQDANGNGRQEEGEFRSLQEAGVAAIGLQREGEPALNNGNVVFGTSELQWSDGHSSRAGDVMFAGHNVPLPDAAMDALAKAQAEAQAKAEAEAKWQQEQDDLLMAEAMRIARYFNQMINTAVPSSAAADASLGFVPMDEASPLHAAAAHEQAMVQAVVGLRGVSAGKPEPPWPPTRRPSCPCGADFVLPLTPAEAAR